MEEETKQCENCLKDINTSKMQLHEAYCFRNIRRCKQCDQPVEKSELEQHMQDNHVLQPCQYCKQSLEKQDLQSHEDSCSFKPQPPKTCSYCNILVDASKYVQHTYMCQNRTKNCEFCQKAFTIRDLDLHEKFCLQDQIKQQTQDKNRNKEIKGSQHNHQIRKQQNDQIESQQNRGISNNNQNIMSNQYQDQSQQNQSRENEFDPNQSMMQENDPEIQRAIQESMRNYQNKSDQQDSNFDGYQSVNYQDEEIQKAIQASITNQRNATNEDDDYIRAIKESMKSAGQDIDSDTERAIIESLRQK